jgi:hypothetical protein
MYPHDHKDRYRLHLLDALTAPFQAKADVRLATATALPACTYANGTSGVGATLTANANGALTVDGVAVALGDRILVKDQATGAQNGIYTVTTLGATGAAFVLTRATDGDTAAEVLAESVVVTEGTANAGLGFINTNGSAPTMGSTALTYAQVTGGTGSVTAANATQAKAASSTAVFLTPHNLQDEKAVQTLTDQATIAFDISLGRNAKVTLGGNRTLGAPTNLYAGASGKIVVTQDGTGSRTLAYNAAWLFAGGTDPTASTAAGAIDVIDWYSPDGTNVVASMTKAYA